MGAKRVLVTGAGGFIGSHLVDNLVRRGYEVKALVRYNSNGALGWLNNLDAELLEQVDIVQGDIQDLGFVISMVEGCDAVINMAALIGIPYSYVAPSSYLSVNALGACNLLEAAKLSEVSRFVQISTSEVYGSAQYVPMDEAHPLHAQSPYAASKISADQYALSFHASFEMPVTVIRPFNTFGPRQSRRAVIPTILSQIANDASEIHLGNVDTTRDFTFVTDTAAGIAAALDGTSQIDGEVINLGVGQEFSILDVAKAAMKIFNREVKIVTEEKRVRPKNSEVRRLLSDNRKAKKLLGWEPVFKSDSDFIDALKLTADWLQNPENTKLYRDNDYVI